MKCVKFVYGAFAFLFVSLCATHEACAQSIVVEAETATITDPNDVVLFSSAERIAATSGDIETFSYDGAGLSGDALMHIGDFAQDFQPVSPSGLDYQSYSFNATTAGSYFLFGRFVVPSDTNILVADDGEFGGTDGSAQTPPNNDSLFLPTDVNIDPEVTSPAIVSNGLADGTPVDQPFWMLLVDDLSPTVPGFGVFGGVPFGDTQSETYNIVAGNNTFAWRGREPGLIVDAFVFSTDSSLSAFQLDSMLGVIPPPGEWNVDGGGLWSESGNWDGAVPDGGTQAVFGSALTGPSATITNDQNPSLANVTFDNANSYTIDGGTISLVGLSQIAVTSGSHEITSVISGATGLLKSGDGDLTLSSANTYSGNTTIDGNGKLIVSNNSALGAAGNTSISGSDSTSQLVLDGVTVTGETLTISARENAAEAAPALVSTSTSTWAGDIVGVVGGFFYNIESQSGTLTIDGSLSAPDTNVRTYRLTGAGDGVITGAIVDVDLIGGQTAENVGVLKQGSGTWTLATAANVADPSNDENYHHGPTVIEAGRLVVLSNGVADNGELRSSVISIAAGATFDVSDFGTYSLLFDQALSGAGTVDASTLAGFDDNVITPGDSVGTLTVDGNLSLTTFNNVPTGSLNYELAAVSTVGSGVNDLISVNGNLVLNADAGTNRFQVNINPTENSLVTGNYRLISYSGTRSGSADGTNFTPTIVDGQGNPLTTRQTVSVSTATNGQVNLAVSGSAANLVWNGNVNDNWDVDATQNWQNGASADRFLQLDNVEFDDTASTQQVVFSENVAPGQVTFNNSGDYRFTGTGGLVGGTSVAVNGTGEVEFDNTGNSFSGATTVSASSSLRFTSSATTGDIMNSGKLSVGSTSVTAGNPVSITNAGFEADTAPMLGATGWTITSGGTDWFTTTAGQPDSVVDPLAAAEGVNWLSGNRLVTGDPASSNPQTITQLIDISGEATLIDAGSAEVNVAFQFADSDPADDGTVTITFFSDVGGTTPIGTALSTGVLVPTGPDGSRPNWEARSLTGAVPSSARSMQLEILNNRLAGTAGNVHFDAFSAAIGDGGFGGPAVLDVAGDLTLADGSELELVIEGPSSFSQVNVDGLFIADGTLSIVTLPTASLSLGNVFDFLNFGAVAGAFDNISLPTLDAGLDWDTSTLLSDGIISIVSLGLAGDFNNDGVVSAADYTVWRDNLGADESSGVLSGNGNGGIVDETDFALWKSSFGNTGAGAIATAQSAVPEPSSFVLSGALMLLGILGRFRSRKKSAIVVQ